MPTYEYACEACKHTFEQVQPMTAKPLKKCPACGKLMLERLVSGGSGFILKGAGFWRNDSKSRKTGGGGSGVGSSGCSGSSSPAATPGGSAEKPAAPSAEPKPANQPDAGSGSKAGSQSPPKPEAKPDPRKKSDNK